MIRYSYSLTYKYKLAPINKYWRKLQRVVNSRREPTIPCMMKAAINIAYSLLYYKTILNRYFYSKV